MRSLVLLGIFLSAGLSVAAEPFEDERIEKEALVLGLEDGMQMEVLSDGRLLVAERGGGLKMYLPTERRTVKLGQIPAAVFGEVGLLGMVAAPDFERSGWVYLFYCPKDKTSTMRLSRFTVVGETLDLTTEKRVLEIAIDGPDAAIHMGGGLARDSKGNLFIGTGDNSPPIPELPVDQRPGHERHDAQRTAANTQDLRGKILRIRPEPNGKYSIPPGNLFTDDRVGRPEIYAMGCRNPYRVMVDPRTDDLYWGDVGPNVDQTIGVGPNGYDEINRARAAGNFGWPMFIGPNEPYREFDFDTRKPGRAFDAMRPENRSKNNTGVRRLPPAQPAFLWYPTQESKEWPALGSGGRSAMVGPVYHFDTNSPSPIKLPDRFERTLFVFEWMRNWIVACKLDAEGKVQSIEPFAKHLLFRRPIDLRIGSDGALYVLEYGDKWNGNTDGQIVRLNYRRGNRAPVARLRASQSAGKNPLQVAFDASASSDQDARDTIRYEWRLNGKPLADTGPLMRTTFMAPGAYAVAVTARDAAGASGVAETTIHVGNAMPQVRFSSPVNGGFFDWNEPIGYRVEARDDEDGPMPGERVIVRADYQVRRAATDEPTHPGLALMRKTTCFACHTAEAQSKGPPYQKVAEKYRDQKDAREKLAQKVVAGGAGVWGAYPMPPHPQHGIEQARLMVDWVLNTTEGPPLSPTTGSEGAFIPTLGAKNLPTGYPDSGVLVVTASATDNGVVAIPPLTGERALVLHARRKKAAYHDVGSGIHVVDDLEDEHGMIAWFGHGDFVGFSEMNLEGIERIICRVRGKSEVNGSIELRLDGPTGPLLGRVAVPAGSGAEVPVTIAPTTGVHDVYFVAAVEGAAGRKPVSLNWAEFRDSAKLAAARAAGREGARQRIEAMKAKAKPRSFVRQWTFDELKAEAAPGSADRGAKLFAELTCAGCHRIGKTGVVVGPDLTDVWERMKKQPQPRQALVRELVEPSHAIEDKYRAHLLTLADGRQLAGIIVSETPQNLRIAANPALPDEVREIPRSRIEERRVSDVSLMPKGLLDTLTREEIEDLLAFLRRDPK